ncbi:MAG: helix-turn-helix transcriptional regulator [Bradyrhizobium sp.]|nr:helix-turn-helix transcriptional regulator [Bradyrhizobium sp.]
MQGQVNLTHHRLVARAAPSRRYTRGGDEMAKRLLGESGGIKMARSPLKRKRARSVAGRKRQPMPKEIRRTPSGKFGARLEQLVNASGMNVKEFAAKIGKGEDSVWAYFKGKAVPHIDDWPKIAASLGLQDARELLPDMPVKAKAKAAD